EKSGDALSHEAHAAELCKALAAVACKTAVEAFGFDLEKHQEVLAAISDIVMEAYAIESSVLRTRQAASEGKLDPVRVAMTQLYAEEGHLRAFERARRVVCAAIQGAGAKDAVAKLQLLYSFEPRNLAELRETIVNA